MINVKMLRLAYPLIKTSIHRRLNTITVPYKINLHVTYACNSKCKTCHIWRKYIDEPHLKETELNTEQWKTFFEKLGARLYWISFSGGEPFLRDDLAEIISSINTKNLCLMSMNTNGLLCEKTYNTLKKSLDILPANVKVFTAISIFGFEDTHNRISGIKNAFQTSEKTYARLKALEEEYGNFHLERELLVCRENLKEISALVDNLNKQRIPFVLTFAQRAAYYNTLETHMEFSGTEKKMIAESLKKIQIPMRNKEDMVRIKFKEAAIKFFEGHETPKCYSSWSSVRVDPYGNLYPCIMRNEIIGNLVSNEMDLARAIRNSKNIDKIHTEVKNRRCSCWTPCEAYQGIVQSLPFSTEVIRTLFRGGIKKLS